MGDPRKVLDPIGLSDGSGRSLEKRITSQISTIGQNVTDYGKNLERGNSAFFQDMGLRMKGNFNNIGGSIMSSAPNTLGLTSSAEDTTFGETTVQGEVRKVNEKTAEGAAIDAQNYNFEKFRQAAGVVAGMVDARKRAPGRAQTLLNSPNKPGGTNTLLTLTGNK